MSVNDCLRSVVGLSNNECACFEEGRPEDYNTSLSGYFIDDPEYGFPLRIPQNIVDCEGNDLWVIMARAREAGITQFLTDFGANIMAGNYKRKAEPFNDWIGKQKGNMNLSGVSTLAGLKINPYIFRGTIGKIFKLELYIANRNGETIEIGFYDDEGMIDGSPIATTEVDIINGKGSITLDETFIHDFMDDYSQKKRLWILYEPGVGKPRNNTIRCGTCGSKDPWQQFLTVQGVTGTDTASIYDGTTSSQYSYGLRINMALSCGNSWLCQNWDFDNDNWARVMAECLVLYHIKKLAGIILQDPTPNKYTQLATREEIAYYRDRANKLLGERMPWLASNVPSVATDCFTCDSPIQVKELMV